MSNEVSPDDHDSVLMAEAPKHSNATIAPSEMLLHASNVENETKVVEIFLAAVPAVTIGLVSVIVDKACASDVPRKDRLLIQIVLLGVALLATLVDQEKNVMLAAALYVTILLSIINAATSRATHEKGGSVKEGSTQRRSDSKCASYFSVLPQSSLSSLMTAACWRGNAPIRVLAVMEVLILPFVGTLVLLTLFRQFVMQRQNKEQEMRGMPTTRTHSNRSFMSSLGIFLSDSDSDPLPSFFRRYFGKASTTTGAPTASFLAANGNSMARLADETRWYEWTAQDVEGWAQHHVDQDIRNLTSHLKAERLDGPSLQYIAVEELRSLCGVPYGDAHRLKRAIAALEQRYGNGVSGATHERAQPQEPLQEQEEDEEAARRGKQGPRQAPAASRADFGSHDDEEAMMSAQHKRAQEVMMRRFGRSLPMVATSSDTPKAPSPQPQHAVEPMRGGMSDSVDLLSGLEPDMLREILLQKKASASSSPPIAVSGEADAPSTHPHSSADPSGSSIPSEILEAMPPHIREIAVRHPDLVRQMMNTKQQGAPPAPPLPPATLRSMPPAEPLKSIPEEERMERGLERKNAQYNHDEVQPPEAEEADDHDEMMGLLPLRRRPRAKIS